MAAAVAGFANGRGLVGVDAARQLERATRQILRDPARRLTPSQCLSPNQYRSRCGVLKYLARRPLAGFGRRMPYAELFGQSLEVSSILSPSTVCSVSMAPHAKKLSASHLCFHNRPALSKSRGKHLPHLLPTSQILLG